MFDGHQSKIRSSTDDGATWTPFCDAPAGVISEMNNLFSIDNKLYCCGQNGFFELHSGGTTPLFSSPSKSTITNCFDAEIHNSNMYLSFSNDVKFSIDNGASWTSVSSGLKISSGNVGRINCLTSFQGNLYAGTYYGGLFKLIE